jgi:hypothetical protein
MSKRKGKNKQRWRAMKQRGYTTGTTAVEWP